MDCICADATRPDGYVRALRGEKAALLLTDPPYCLLTRRRRGGDLRDNRNRKIDRAPAVRFESVRDYRTFTGQWLPLAVEHLQPHAPLVIWTNFLGKEPIVSTARKLGFAHTLGEFVWAKRTRNVNANEQVLRVYEVALVLSRTPPPPPDLSKPPLPWSVVTGYDDEGEGVKWGAHPHHKPFSSIAPLLLTWSRPGDLVLDPFAGSGSIPVASVRLQRRTACLEKEPEWVARVNERLKQTASA
ncbi:MAG: site-specific DNA-methyltransferase [Myxococcaceae bacterium]|nr:site-specific DNA-methyltransferase [Myxococcaceae bacterium]